MRYDERVMFCGQVCFCLLNNPLRKVWLTVHGVLTDRFIVSGFYSPFHFEIFRETRPFQPILSPTQVVVTLGTKNGYCENSYCDHELLSFSKLSAGQKEAITGNTSITQAIGKTA